MSQTPAEPEPITLEVHDSTIGQATDTRPQPDDNPKEPDHG